MYTDLENIFFKRNVFKLIGANRIGVFGSYARGEKFNDIDLLLDEDPGYEKREMLKKLIETELHISCDVVVKNKLEPIILHYVNKDLMYVQNR